MPATWQRPLAAGCAVAALVALAAAAMRARRWRNSRGQMIALREALKLRQALKHKLGIDIGGTLAKIVFAIDPAAADDRTAVREIVTWNDVTTMHDDLSFTARSGGRLRSPSRDTPPLLGAQWLATPASWG